MTARPEYIPVSLHCGRIQRILKDERLPVDALCKLYRQQQGPGGKATFVVAMAEKLLELYEALEIERSGRLKRI